MKKIVEQITILFSLFSAAKLFINLPNVTADGRIV